MILIPHSDHSVVCLHCFRLWNEISSTCCDEKYPFDACKFTEAASTLQSCKEMVCLTLYQCQILLTLNHGHIH